MSRSRKKTPRCGDDKSKGFKEIANRKFRRHVDFSEDAIPLNHKSYKKFFCSYDICDYETKFITFEEHWRGAVRWWNSWGYRYYPYPNRTQELKEYNKYYIWK